MSTASTNAASTKSAEPSQSAASCCTLPQPAPAPAPTQPAATSAATVKPAEPSQSAALCCATPQTPPPELTDRQLTALEMLLTGASVTSVAKSLNVSRGTIHRWHQEPAFAAELARQRRQVYQGVADRLTALTNKALDVLDKQMSHPNPRIAFAANPANCACICPCACYNQS
jgi:hypothetical protein